MSQRVAGFPRHLTAVAHGENPQDRTASSTLGNPYVAVSGSPL
ncbi:MAG: hypothetical protein RMX35_12995 [Nostoc sp. DcaGUA01]|nr:hypothetical protein [Nostoc sp. DcaGUA01]